MSPTTPVVLYDGACGLCHASVRFILRRERAPHFHFAPLEGPTADALRAVHPGRIPTDTRTVVVIDGDAVHLRSRAFFHIARHLRQPWRLTSGLRVLPAWLTDLPYRLIARLRTRLWGRADACSLPSPEHAARMLP